MPPVYLPVTLPPAAFVGLEKFCRDFAGVMKKQLNYDKADGLDLMIEREKSDDLNLTEAMPELEMSAMDTTVRIGWKKTGFDALELQFRKSGATMWQAANKSTVSEFEFAPPLMTPNVPEKLEFRAVYLIKNQRVGQWSPVYTRTVG